MAKAGRAGVALFLTTVASFIGAAIGIVILMFFSPFLAQVSRNFTSAEYFSIILLGLIGAATITNGSALKALMMVLAGLLLGTIGTGINSGALRFTMGAVNLYDGFGIVVVAMGLFGVAEIIHSVRLTRGAMTDEKITLRTMIPTREDMREFPMPALRGSGIGAFIGALPGAGQTIAAFMSYAVEKRLSHTPERFGRGAIPRHHRTRSVEQCRQHYRLHPDAHARHPGQRDDGADPRRAADPWRDTGAEPHLEPSGHLLGAGGELLDRQHSPRHPEPAADQHLGCG